MSAPQPADSRVWLVDVEEHAKFVVRIDQTALGLPAETPHATVTNLLAQAADLLVANQHPDAVRHHVERKVGDIAPVGHVVSDAPVSPHADAGAPVPQPEGQMQYTHWAYFALPEQAKACAAELREAFTARTRIEQVEPPTLPAERWLLRAMTVFPHNELIHRHNDVEAVVKRHQGSYDGGEAGGFDAETGVMITPPTRFDLSE